MSKKKCLYFLDNSIKEIEFMKSLLDGHEPDGAQAFLESYMEAQRLLNQGLHHAIAPILSSELKALGEEPSIKTI